MYILFGGNMLGKRPRPMIGKLSELLVSGNRAGLFDMAAMTSPRSPLDLKMQSPRGLKNYDVGGVGLGIVAALEKSGHGGREILAKYAICSPNLNRSEPIPVNSAKKSERLTNGNNEEAEEESLENYTYVTCRHGPNKTSFTRVYYDGVERSIDNNPRNDLGRSNNLGIFHTSPSSCSEEFSVFPTSDFLSSCHLCRKKLHGKDIYMYRGDKAFCSTECRSRQIMMDERKERCRSEASRSVDVSSSSYSRDQIFSTGIVAS
ncbi:hypothetical protein FEM48_Zijuj08G0024300 [Ziziphus jujuba var. spinosa]|uniref:FLZ-type domain-containing protein n=1 Tax=Ziziphus jujuba var. spinosa TaxID=714518 RepID=A0A978UWF9_ZIZJJ|nr:hypothetical protein FEM48_Zijuj08G0024300 [Ziziphus jujuba var. spinosa]